MSSGDGFDRGASPHTGREVGRLAEHAGGELGRARQTYVRRQPEQTVLHGVVREHLETFLADARRRGGGEGLPSFVEREMREFLTCGAMASGFARFRCRDCAHEVLVAFSCCPDMETMKSPVRRPRQ